MRKHRLYGVAIAMLLGTSLIDHRPRTIPQHHAAVTDVNRGGIRLASVALLPDAQHLTAAVPATSGATSPAGLLRPGSTNFAERLWTWVAYVDAHTPPRRTPPPTPHPAPSTAAAGGHAQVAPAPASGDVWAGLRQCESGGNYSDNTGNGYYGAYQFSLSTWHGLGFAGLPSQAPAAVQDQAAQRLQSRSGWGQWPNCSRRLHLT